MSLSLPELIERGEQAAERLGRARQASDRNPDNTFLEQTYDEAYAAYLKADNAVLNAENKRHELRGGKNV